MIKLDTPPALAIVDMQNGFCHEQGTFGKLGMQVDATAIVPKINELRATCHALGIPVCLTRVGFSADYCDKGIGNIDEADRIEEVKGFIRGTWDWEILDELTLDETKGEVVLDKTRNSAFRGTSFGQMLAQRGVDYLIVTGVGTNVCVECTARDAYQMDLHVTTVSDATATVEEQDHLASLRNLRYFGGTAATAEVIEALRSP